MRLAANRSSCSTCPNARLGIEFWVIPSMPGSPDDPVYGRATNGAAVAASIEEDEAWAEETPER